MQFLSIYNNLFSLLISILFALILVFSPLQIDAANTSIKNMYEQALLSSNNGDFLEALKLWDEFLRIYPEDPLALSNRGNIRLILGDPKGAIADQTKAINLLPNEPDPYLNRGIAEEALELWNEAEEDYEKSLSYDPNYSSALYNLANLNAHKGNWIKAENLFHQAGTQGKGFAMAFSSEALVKYQLDDLEAAEAQLRKVIRKYPFFADARAGLCALLWRKGYVGEAESNWAAVSGLDMRYKEKDWLLNVRKWPQIPTEDLLSFLDLHRP